jgi:glycerophosphoryl diester phosphodiesterase
MLKDLKLLCMKNPLIFLFLLILLGGCQSSLRLQDAQALRTYLSWSPTSQPLISAHRGGPAPGLPENCLATFEAVLGYVPALIEYDVRMTRDSVLVLMHDASLNRTTTGEGKVAEKDFAELATIRLKDNDGKLTSYAIPTCAEALKWGRKKAVATVDVKRGVPYARVIKEVREHQLEAYVVIITYDLQSAREVHRLAPEMMISVSARNGREVTDLLESGIPYDRLIAFTGTRRAEPELYERLHQAGIRCIIGTMGNLDRQAEAKGNQVYKELILKGADVLATDRPRAAAQALQEMPYFRK